MASSSSHRRFSSDQEAPVRQRITAAVAPIKRQSKVVVPDQPDPTSSTAQRVAPKRSKLNLGLLVPKPSLSSKLSNSKLTKDKENIKSDSNSKLSARDIPPSAFHDVGKAKENVEKQERRRSLLGGSASKLGGLGSLVRHASMGFLKDVTNASSKDPSPDASQFVEIGVEDVPQDVEDPDQTIIDIQGHVVRNHGHTQENVNRKLLQEINDPDIAEIVVVKRAKSRTSLDANWAQESGTALASSRKEVQVTAETDIEASQKRNSGWWAKKKPDESETRPKARRRLSAILTPSSLTSDLPPQESSSVAPEAEGKGSLVIRAIRSVRSLAQVTAEEGKPKAEAKPEPIQQVDSPMVESARRIQKKPAFVLRRASDSTSPRGFGGLSSSDQNSHPSRLVPSTRRRVSAQYDPHPVPEQVSVAAQRAATPDVEVPSTATPRPRKPYIVNPENRVSVVSILSADESDAVADMKANRRSSTGSNIRWDPEAMSQQAKKVRQEREERLKLKLQLERENVQNGLPPNERLERKAKSIAAKRRTPLSSIFDGLDISSPSAVPSQNMPSDSLSTAQRPSSTAPVDPIIAATIALIHQPTPQTSEILPEAVPRPRLKGKDHNRPRPVGIIATESDQNDANGDLQTLVGTLDLSMTSEGTPSIDAMTPVAESTPVLRKATGEQPADSKRALSPSKASGDFILTEGSNSPPRRRASKSSRVVQQAAAWPPAAPPPPPKDRSSPRPTDTPATSQPERARTSSSNSVPPSAFHLRLNSESKKDVASLTLRTLRSEQGNVSKKAQFYGDLERRATLEQELGVQRRQTSHPQNNSLPSVRSRQNSFPVLSATAATVSGPAHRVDELFEAAGNKAHVEVEVAQGQIDSSLLATSESPASTSSSDTSTEVFVYTGVDAQSPKPASIAPTTEYSFCNEFSSYDEVSKADLPNSPAKNITPVANLPEDVFSNLSTKVRAGHQRRESVVSVESDASYCVVNKHSPEKAGRRPLVLHRHQISTDSADQYVNDTFAFASKKNLFPGIPSHRTGVIRPSHRRNRSVVSVSSVQSRRSRISNHSTSSSLSLSALRRPGIGEKMMLSRQPLPDISSSSSLSFGASNDSLQTDRITLPSCPSSPSETGFASVESFFDRPRTRMSPTSSVFSVFGIEPTSKPASRGNLFGHKRPMSLISNYSGLGVISDEEERRGEGQQLIHEGTDPSHSGEQSTSQISIDVETMDKMLQEEIEKASVSRVRLQGMGHCRQNSSALYQPSIAETLEEAAESALPPSLSPPRSRGSSSTTDASQSRPSVSTEDHNVAIVEPEVETNMVLRRYYAFQREAQEALDHSHTVWEDTAFSADELSEFKPPTEPEEVKNFLTESRRYYMELPTEIRARRRALAAPYPAAINAMLEDKPDSPVDGAFKDLSTWDHRVRKVSDSKGRTRKLSDEKGRSRKVSQEK
ncbi:hypothetical protein FRC17_010898, partial [Serendipita sp. 399]